MPVATPLPMDRWRISDSVRASTSDDGLVVLDVAGGQVFAASPIGARIWQLLEQRRTDEEIARQVADDYDMPIDRVHRDVVAFVGALRDRGLVVLEP